MDLIRPFNKTHKEGHMSIPSTPLSPEAELCMGALIIIEDDFETLADPQEITCALLDLSSKLAQNSYRLTELPSWLEIPIKGIEILKSNIELPGMAEQARKYMHNGLYDVVKLAYRSTRKAAAPFLTALAELMAAVHLNSPPARFSFGKIISTCPAASARLAAIKALAEVSFAKHERDIANVAERDFNAEVREAAHLAHTEGMKNYVDSDDGLY